MNPNTNCQELLERMKSIRAKRFYRVAELQNEAERMSDWREHVKSAPVAALAGSAIVGFIAVLSATRKPSSAAGLRQVDSQSPNVALEASLLPPGYLMKSAIRILTGVALTASKTYLSKQLNLYSKRSKS